MFSKSHTVFIAVTSLLLATCQPDEAQPEQVAAPTLAMATDEPTPCYQCLDLMVGSYFFDGTEIWVPNAAQSPLQPGNLMMSVEVDWATPKIVFSSSQYQFCKRPPKLWTYADFTYQDLWLYECEPAWTSTTVSPDKHELTFNLDNDFLNCAFGANMGGFKFAVPIY